jgi:MFS transporter, SP family, arabinose:H+ symporter
MNNSKIYFWSLTVSLGGFLFGLDTALISGVERTVQQLWNMSDVMTGQMVAMALYGTIIGALVGGMPAQHLGRRPTLFIIAVIYLISAVGSALAPGAGYLMLFRFIGGLSVGASSVVAPMYIAELSPDNKRGHLTALFQFNIVLGIMIAYLSNWLIGTGGPENWRWMLGVEAFPALLFAILIPRIPESPRWLILKRGDDEEALRILAIVDPQNAEKSIHEIKKSASANEKSAGIGEFFTRRYKLPIILVVLFAFFNQVSGINAVLYYAPRIFENAGIGNSIALLSSVGIGVVNLIFTMAGMVLIDRMGRRFLMYIGSIGYIISLSLVAVLFSMNIDGTVLLPVLLFVFIAAHAIGQGAVIWVFISEIVPNRVRSWGNSLGSATHWIFAAVIAGNFPFVARQFGQAPIFAFFAFMMVLQLLFVWKMMPETKNVSLEEMEKKMTLR